MSKTITDEEYALFQKIVKVWYHDQAEMTGAYFICGEGGEVDDNGMPEIILVCPTPGLGAEYTVGYKKMVSD